MRVRSRLVLPLLFLVTACGGDDPAPVAAAPPPPQVVARPFADVAVFIAHSAPATAVARNEAAIAAEVAARIVAVPVDVGAVVRRDEILVRLDARDAELAVDRARAGVAQAKARLAQSDANLRRAESLAAARFYSAEALAQRVTERDVVDADLAQAMAALATAQRALAKHVVRAPFDGIVGKRQAQVGALAVPGTPLLTLSERAPVEVAAAIQVKDVEALRGATAVRFESAAGSTRLRLLRLADVIERGARTVEARFAVDGTDAPAPAAGMEGRVAWRGAAPHLPAELVLRRDGRYGVFVVAGDVARFVPLEAAQEGRPAPFAGAATQLIAVDGRHALRDGMTVRH